MSQTDLLKSVKEYFEKYIFQAHKDNSLNISAKLSSYKINPVLVRYLSRVLEDDFTPEGVAKALYYPRVLGTSLNTTFGNRMQRMFVELGLASGSLIQGIDIEFIDKVDSRKKWCQLKSGPETINSEDVQPILNKFQSLVARGRNNHALNFNNNDLLVGILYGDDGQQNGHYQRINESFPVIIGQDLWHRITGFEGFYENLTAELDGLIGSLDIDDFFDSGLEKLTQEIKDSLAFNFPDPAL